MPVVLRPEDNCWAYSPSTVDLSNACDEFADDKDLGFTRGGTSGATASPNRPVLLLEDNSGASPALPTRHPTPK